MICVKDFSLFFLIPQDDQKGQESIADLLSSGPWPPQIGEHLAVLRLRNSQSNIKICEFLGFVPGLPLHISENLKVKVYEEYTLDIPNNLSLWQDNDNSEYLIERVSILPVRPQIEVVPSLSRMTRSGKKMIFQVENFDIIESISNPNVSAVVPGFTSPIGT